MGLGRELHVYESILSTSAMGLGISFRGAITEELLRKAFFHTQTEHPILRMVIETCNEKQTFVEKPNQKMHLEVLHSSELDAGELLTAWVNQPRDHSESQVYFQYSPPSRSRHEHLLLLVANHAGMDGSGLLHIVASFCGYLGQLVSGSDVEPKSRDFYDLLVRAPLPEEMKKPEIPQDILAGPAVEKARVVEGHAPGIRHFHEKLSIEATEKLLRMYISFI
ncbi:hypothetical protein BSKO_06785 [Bryopsis sp. KO-2023]|nr:hypothetical protein BSKO_06785 [Bryopsis sp. KO-2023]